MACDNRHDAALMNAPRFDLARFEQAHARIVSAVHRTPMLRSQTLSNRVGAPVYLKCENLQKTGAFKVRGALHRLLQLSDEQRARGVATISAGQPRAGTRLGGDGCGRSLPGGHARECVAHQNPGE